MNDHSSNKTTGAPTRNWSGFALSWTTACLLLMVGCSAKHHRKAADNETYKIVELVEQRVFGKTNAFTIDTPYSARKPADITPPELIEDRLQTNWRALSIEGA